MEVKGNALTDHYAALTKVRFLTRGIQRGHCKISVVSP